MAAPEQSYSSQPKSGGLSAIRDIARQLAGAEVTDLEAVYGGRNNSIFRIRRRDGADFALKRYVTPQGEGFDRLDAEYEGLTFLTAQRRLPVPMPIAVERVVGCALFEWIDGESVGLPTDDDIEAAANFVLQLKELSSSTGADAVPPAREACLSGAEIVGQVQRRVGHLLHAADGHDALRYFIEREFLPLFARATLRARWGYQEQGLDFRLELQRDLQVLSPSDFGFHNSVRRHDGSLVFVDFEYFGCDDPVKLVVDFLLHPGMTLNESQKRRFLSRVLPTFVAGDAEFLIRMRLLYTLYGLRWCMILLNEFLPERWARRELAGPFDHAAEQSRQLAKAQRLLNELDVQDSLDAGENAAS